MIINLDPPGQPHWLSKPKRTVLRLIRSEGPRQLRLMLRDRPRHLRLVKTRTPAPLSSSTHVRRPKFELVIA
jgi:hypothetical protein